MRRQGQLDHSRIPVAPLLATAALGGCSGIQSVHHAAGPHAGAIGTIGLVMYAGAAIIFVLVMGLTAWALLAPPDRRGWLSRPAVVPIGGVIFPLVVLTALLTYGLAIASKLSRPAPADALQIEVVGEQFWWRVIYRDPDGGPAFETANEIHIPVGQPVSFILKSADVIHSFWVPALGGKLDMIPGRANAFVLEAAREGVYRGQCAEYCGDQHALMAFDVVADAPENFATWREGAASAAAVPDAGDIQDGKAIFLAAGCGACHAIRGTEASGTLGPDLTHVGSRRMLAAGVLPNNIASLSAWIVRAQEIKPGSRMPSFDIFSEAELDALSAYLVSLK